MEDPPPVFVVIGGGIAGVSCAEALVSYLPLCQVKILSLSPLVKAVRNIQELSRTLVSFNVEETSIKDYEKVHPQIHLLQATATHVDHTNKIVHTNHGDIIRYTKLCVCTGARQKLIFPDSDHVIGIRDTATAVELDSKLSKAERIIVVGNGGIATELVFQVHDCAVIWAIKDKAIGQVFFDSGAAEFFLPMLERKDEEPKKAKSTLIHRMKRMSYKLSATAKVTAEDSDHSKAVGSALGPDWHQKLNLKGPNHSLNHIHVEYNCEVKQIKTSNSILSNSLDKKSTNCDWPVYVELTNGKVLGCDFVVSATGVTPNVDIFTKLPCTIASDGGVHVDQNMRVCGVNDVYAAGDVCSTGLWPRSEHWFQMRLWTQARQMGIFAALCMVRHYESNVTECVDGENNVPSDICFDLFAHVTNFFGKKVCLLGRYNAQDLDKNELELLVRTTPGEEYIKVVLMGGQMQGAVLIGETDLEETFENLILNETNLSFLGEDLLNPDVDIADYFD